jgi:hypothetical protein
VSNYLTARKRRFFVSLRERQAVEARQLEHEAALKRIGELSMENELLRERCRRQERPLGKTKLPR